MSNSLRVARLMNIMKAFREADTECCLSQDEELILGFIYERHHREISTIVSDIVVARSFGTPPTVQRRVNRLAKNGMLIFSKHKNDSRKNNLALSDTAVLYLDRLAGRLETIFE